MHTNVRRRRAVLVAILFTVATSILTGTTQSAPARPDPQVGSPEQDRPNILIILTDDQRRFGTMQVMPFARRWFGGLGRTFPNAFATTPLCCPSRASILTGCYAHNHGIVNNAGTGRTIFDQGATIERYLQDAGYRTAIFGKLFNFWRIEDDPAYFDRWAIVTPTPDSNGYRGGAWNVQGTIRTIDRYSTDYIASMGTRFIRAGEQDDSEPWFLELSTYAPHLRAIPEPAYEDAPVGPFRPTAAMQEQDRSDKPPFIRGERTALRGVGISRQKALRTLLSVDDLVADIAETLRRTGEARDTLVFFLSDNGFLWGEHGLRSKGYPYGPSVRIPFYVRWPGHIRPGSVDDRLAANIDVAPTILDAARIDPDPDEPMDGRSLLDDTWSRDRILLESWPWGGASAPRWASLWTRRYQYTEYYAEDGDIVFREFYALRADPWQLTNLLHDGRPGNDPDVEALHDRLRLDMGCVGAACP